MEAIQAHTIEYDRRKNNYYLHEKDKEQRLVKRYDSIQADSETNEALEITQGLEASIKEANERKQAEQNEWVNLSEYWLQVADTKDWENAKSRLDKSKTCKMSVVKRKRDALKHFKQRAVKKAESLGIEYKTEYVKSVNRWGVECHMNRKDLFIRRKHLRLFFTTNKQEKHTYALVRNRQAQTIKVFGVDNHIQNKLATHGIQYNTFIARLHRGWSVEKASTTPPANRDSDRFLEMYPHRAHELRKPVKKSNKQILAEYEGKTFYRRRATLQDLLQENGITEKQFCNRIRNGWSFASATTLDNGGYTEEARKRHNKRDIAKHVRQSRAKRYR